MYHRVLPADDARAAVEEPGMVVTPLTFRGHMRTVKELFEPVSLREWVERRRDGRPLPPKACAITFDDGWLDNYQFGLPILREEQVPATLFAVAGMIGTNRRFWPNRVARVLDVAGPQLAAPELQWLSRLGARSGGGRESVARVIKAAKDFDDRHLDQKLRRTEEFLGLQPEMQPDLMSWEQLRAMRDSGVVEIGSHTCNHTRLIDGLQSSTLLEEVVKSRLILQENLGGSIDLFCYPNGDVSSAATRLVRENYLAAVTTSPGINRKSSDLHLLSRVGVHEDVSATDMEFRARLSGWF